MSGKQGFLQPGKTEADPAQDRRLNGRIAKSWLRDSLRSLGLALALALPAAADLSSYAFVEDDGTLRIDGKTVRLYGIYIPATDQDCRTFERPVRCAPQAALALGFKIQSFVHCEEKGREPNGTIIGLCRVGRDSFSPGEDLAAYLLQHGWALALPDAPFEYQALERIARSRGIGVWGRKLVPP